MANESQVRRVLLWTAGLSIAYVAVAYGLLPLLWEARNRDIKISPEAMVTRTPSDIPGDPINVGLTGSQAQVIAAFAAAKWDTANAVTLKTAAEIGLSVLFDKPYPDAPVSPLLYEGRPQDLAFEKPVGNSARSRHHVRFWRTAKIIDGQILWLGAASFDRGVGFSHDTGEITHHIAPDIDAERDALMAGLRSAGRIDATIVITGIGATRSGRNGGGDPYVTDGNALIGRLEAGPGYSPGPLPP